jgi:hypothetical protein
MTAIRHHTLKGDRKIVLAEEHLHGSQKAMPCQNAHIPTKRGMAGE